MTEQRRRLERALRGCAERGVPDVADPWPAIKERVTGEQMSEEPVSGGHGDEERASSETRRRSWLPQLVPNTPLGWTLAVLSVLVLGAGAFAASGPVDVLRQNGLPGGVDPGSERGHGRQGVSEEWAEDLLRQTVPEIEEANLDVRLNEKRTVDGITISLDRAYADEDNVVLVYSSSGWDKQAIGTSGVHMAKLEDASDATFRSFGSTGVSADPRQKPGEDRREPWVGREVSVEILYPSQKLEASGRHDFRVMMAPDPGPGEGGRGREGPARATKPLAFDFTIPVHEVDVIDVGQTVEANGMRMTLERVESSPAGTQAFLCFDPPRDSRYNWLPLVGRPWTERPSIDSIEALANDPVNHHEEPGEPTGCVGYDLFGSSYNDPGTHSFTVTRIEGRTRAAAPPEETVRGPWTFEFEVPGR